MVYLHSDLLMYLQPHQLHLAPNLPSFQPYTSWWAHPWEVWEPHTPNNSHFQCRFRIASDRQCKWTLVVFLPHPQALLSIPLFRHYLLRLAAHRQCQYEAREVWLAKIRHQRSLLQLFHLPFSKPDHLLVSCGKSRQLRSQSSGTDLVDLRLEQSRCPFRDLKCELGAIWGWQEFEKESIRVNRAYLWKGFCEWRQDCQDDTFCDSLFPNPLFDSKLPCLDDNHLWKSLSMSSTIGLSPIFWANLTCQIHRLTRINREISLLTIDLMALKLS